MAAGKNKRQLHFGSVINVYWWGNSWTAPSDGMMVVRVNALQSGATSWYWYINDSSISGISGVGSWSHLLRGTETMSYTIPVVKGATYSTSAIDGVATCQCLFYPFV